MAQPASRHALARAGDTDPIHPRLVVLAAQADSQTCFLSVALETYVALERLISPELVTDSQEIPITRTELGTLLRVLNDEMKRQIDSLADTTTALHAFVADKAGAS